MCLAVAFEPLLHLPGLSICRPAKIDGVHGNREEPVAEGGFVPSQWRPRGSIEGNQISAAPERSGYWDVSGHEREEEDGLL